MPNDEAPFTLVYSGFDPVLAGMLQRMLEAEGIECRHVGTHYPAEIGVGALACEQRLEVPPESEQQARELIAEATREDVPSSAAEGG
jgi:Putative prokaryotic signal transducing protein